MLKVRKILMSIIRFVFVWLLIISAFVFAMFQGGIVSWTIFYAVLPFVLYSILLFFYPLTDFTVQREIPASMLQNGEKLRVKLVLQRKFRFPLLYIVIQEDWENSTVLKVKGGFKKIITFGLKKEMVWNYEIPQMPRGEHVLKGVKIEAIDFFGWIKKTHVIPVTNTIIVYPKTIAVEFRPTEAQYELGSAIAPYHIVADTTIAAGIRDYQPGDRMSLIHWKSFARTQTLMTKEFEDRRSQDISIIFDRRSIAAFEERVEFAAAIVREALSQKVGMNFISIGTDSVVFPSIQSETQFKEVFIHLARVVPDEQQDLTTLAQLRNETEQVGSMIVITNNPDGSLLAEMRSQVEHVRQLICFVIMNDDATIHGQIAKNIAFARSKGMTIRTLTRANFLSAFSEVTHL